jgi:hypothetical protein
MPGCGSGVVVSSWSSPRSQHHAAVARKIHLSHLFRFQEPPLGKPIEKIWIGKTRKALHVMSTPLRFGPDPLITIPACGFWKCRISRPDKGSHSITPQQGQKLLALLAATTKEFCPPVNPERVWMPPVLQLDFSTFWLGCNWSCVRLQSCGLYDATGQYAVRKTGSTSAQRAVTLEPRAWVLLS